jgi:hypothetical protein
VIDNVTSPAVIEIMTDKAVNISGRVVRSSGQPIAGVTLDLCGSNASTDTSGYWHKTFDQGASFCVRVLSGLPAGYTDIKGTGNNYCQANASSYEFQISGENRLINCSYSDTRSWDVSADDRYDFLVGYIVTTTTTTSSTTSSSSSSTTSTTSTTIPECAMPGNDPPCGEVELSEIVTAINQWAAGALDQGDVIDLINSWADPLEYPPN